MKIAIIDDGISDIIVDTNCSIEHYEIENNCIVPLTAKMCQHNSHGTSCATILTQIANEIELVDIKIFHANKASVSDTIIALEWCLKQPISIINMSFGTTDYLDFSKLEPVLQQLIDKRVFLVAAHNNHQIKSFPAIRKNVFGVRMDYSTVLNNGEFGIKICNELPMECCFAAHYDIDSNINSSVFKSGNSFAAPIITGHIANYLISNPQASFAEVFMYLKNKATKKTIICRPILNTIKKIFFISNIPIIAFHDDDNNLFWEIRDKFISDDYEIAAFVENNEDKISIPVSFYIKETDSISKELIFAWERIYHRDVFLLCLKTHRYNTDCLWDIVDLLVSSTENEYQINAPDDIIFCKNILEVYRSIVTYFIEEESSCEE